MVWSVSRYYPIIHFMRLRKTTRTYDSIRQAMIWTGYFLRSPSLKYYTTVTCLFDTLMTMGTYSLTQSQNYGGACYWLNLILLQEKIRKGRWKNFPLVGQISHNGVITRCYLLLWIILNYLQKATRLEYFGIYRVADVSAVISPVINHTYLM